MEIIITDHAKKRVKERCGIKKSSASRYAELAFNRGKVRNDFTGAIRKWLDKIYIPERRGDIYVFGDKAFVFVEEDAGSKAVLVTAIPIPSKLAKYTKLN